MSRSNEATPTLGVLLRARRRQLVVLAGLILLLGVGPRLVGFMGDPQAADRKSLPHSGYLVMRFKTDPAVGALVAIDAQRAHVRDRGGRRTLMAKKIVGGPGDWYRVEGDKVYVNETVIGRRHALVLQKIDRPLAQSTRVPDGHVVIAGTHPRSFDSRYFGPVPATAIEGHLVPLY